MYYAVLISFVITTWFVLYHFVLLVSSQVASSVLMNGAEVVGAGRMAEITCVHQFWHCYISSLLIPDASAACCVSAQSASPLFVACL